MILHAVLEADDGPELDISIGGVLTMLLESLPNIFISTGCFVTATNKYLSLFTLIINCCISYN